MGRSIVRSTTSWRWSGIQKHQPWLYPADPSLLPSPFLEVVYDGVPPPRRDIPNFENSLMGTQLRKPKAGLLHLWMKHTGSIHLCIHRYNLRVGSRARNSPQVGAPWGYIKFCVLHCNHIFGQMVWGEILEERLLGMRWGCLWLLGVLKLLWVLCNEAINAVYSMMRVWGRTGCGRKVSDLCMGAWEYADPFKVCTYTRIVCMALINRTCNVHPHRLGARLCCKPAIAIPTDGTDPANDIDVYAGGKF